MPKTQTQQNKLDLDYYESVIIFNSLTDETYLTSIIDVAKPEYFKNENIKLIFNQISDYYKKRNAYFIGYFHFLPLLFPSPQNCPTHSTPSN